MRNGILGSVAVLLLAASLAGAQMPYPGSGMPAYPNAMPAYGNPYPYGYPQYAPRNPGYPTGGQYYPSAGQFNPGAGQYNPGAGQYNPGGQYPACPSAGPGYRVYGPLSSLTPYPANPVQGNLTPLKPEQAAGERNGTNSAGRNPSSVAGVSGLLKRVQARLPARPVSQGPDDPPQVQELPPVQATPAPAVKLPAPTVTHTLPTIDHAPSGCGTDPCCPAEPCLVQDCEPEKKPCEPPCKKKDPRFWFDPEYLHWWVSNGPIIPLVTDPPVASGVGALGDPNTKILFGNKPLDFGGLNGVRATFGGWIDSDSRLGVEASGFLLENGVVHFSRASDSNGNPATFIPVFRPDLGVEGSFTISDPNATFLGQPAPLAGSIDIAAASRLWGTEMNGIFNVLRFEGLSLDLLAGMRYLDLQESIDIHANLSDRTFDVTDVVTDRFHTRNQFFGGQVGTRIGYQYGPVFASLTLKAALGATYEVVNVSGSTTESGAGSPSPGTFPGGILTQPTNIGRQGRDEFTIVPQATFKGGWEFFPFLRVFAGYDFLYWNRVVRPGNQIDHSVNQTQQLGGMLVGPARPMPLFNKSDFWAHGFNAGLELRY